MRGHLVKRSKNTWSIVVDLPRDSSTGKRKQKWQTIKGTKKDAERELRATLTRLETSGYIESTKQSVGEYLEQWIRDYATTNVSPRTLERYIEIISKHLIPALGAIPLLSLQPYHVQSYYSQALKSGRRDGKGGLSARTVYHHHRVLFEALKYGVKHGILTRNVAESVDPPRPEHREMASIGRDELNSLLEAARDSHYYVLFYTAAYTGLRRSELLALRWHHIDLDMATLSVVESLHLLHNGEYVIKQPKTKRSRRTVALSPSLAIVLREHKMTQATNREQFGLPPLQPNDLVFSNLNGTPYNPDRVTQSFHRIAKSIGLKLRLHDLRHTHATIMLQQGVHPKVVSERLGHQSISITLDTYSHVLPGMQEAAAMRFEEGLQSGNTVCTNPHG